MIRPSKPDDIDAIVRVWRTASELAHSFLSPQFMDAEAENVRHVYPAFARIWVTEADTDVVGFIAMIEDEIGALFLSPKHHGAGLGRAMVDFVVDLTGPVTVRVFRDNQIGRKFYEGYGFKFLEDEFHELSGHWLQKMTFTPDCT